MVIGDVRRRLVLGGVRGNEGRDVSEDDHGTSDEEEAGPPPEVEMHNIITWTPLVIKILTSSSRRRCGCRTSA